MINSTSPASLRITQLPYLFYTRKIVHQPIITENYDTIITRANSRCFANKPCSTQNERDPFEKAREPLHATLDALKEKKNMKKKKGKRSNGKKKERDTRRERKKNPTRRGTGSVGLFADAKEETRRRGSRVWGARVARLMRRELPRESPARAHRYTHACVCARVCDRSRVQSRRARGEAGKKDPPPSTRAPRRDTEMNGTARSRAG